MTNIPRCFAYYEEMDPVCDGTGPDDPPCGMRDRCAAMRANLADKGELLNQYGSVKEATDAEGNDASEFVPHGSFDELAATCDVLIEEYGVQDGAVLGGAFGEDESEVAPAPATETKPKKPKGRKTARPYKDFRKRKFDRRKFLRPGRKARAMAKRALQRTAKEKRAGLREMFRDFCIQIATSLPEYKWARPQEAVAPGYLYIQDRLKSSDYATIYCRTSFGRDVAVANIRVKPRDMTLILGLPFKPDALSQEVRKKLNPQPYKDGVFMYKTDHLDKEGLAVAAEALAKACRSGAIQLPKPRLHGPKPPNSPGDARRSML